MDVPFSPWQSATGGGVRRWSTHCAVVVDAPCGTEWSAEVIPPGVHWRAPDCWPGRTHGDSGTDIDNHNNNLVLTVLI